MTQAEVAAALGVTKNTVVKWENGVHYPQRNAGAIEALLDIEIPEPEPLPETELAG